MFHTVLKTIVVSTVFALVAICGYLLGEYRGHTGGYADGTRTTDQNWNRGVHEYLAVLDGTTDPAVSWADREIDPPHERLERRLKSLVAYINLRAGERDALRRENMEVREELLSVHEMYGKELRKIAAIADGIQAASTVDTGGPVTAAAVKLLGF